MEQADQTLHDFVLNLLSDSQALAAFGQDPAAVLDHAGLSGISAADVQEVIPLVMDYVPAHAQVLDSVLSQLPVDSLGTGQLGAIQQLQFVTQALGGVGVPGVLGFDSAGNFGNSAVWGNLHATSDGAGGVAAQGGLHTPLGVVAAAPLDLGPDGVHTTVWAQQTPLGNGSVSVDLPGIGGALGMPSGFSAASDVTDALDGQIGSVSSVTNVIGNNVNTASNLLTGAADLTAGALANPTDLAGALSNPAAAVTALTGVVGSYAEYGTSSLPAPVNAVAGQAVHTVTSTVQSVAGQATSALPTDAVTSHLPVADATHVLGTVTGVVGDVTGSLGVGSLGNGALGVGSLSGLTSHLDPSQATHAVTSTLSTVTDTVTSTVGSVASHSAVSGLTSTVTGSTTASDHSGITSDLGHVTDLLHLPGL